MGVQPDTATAEWVKGVGNEFAERLATLGLIPSRESSEPATLGTFLDTYVEMRTDVKPDTKVVWSHTQRNLIAHFGPRKVLTDITEGDADEFKLFLLDQGLAQATVHKRLQIARQFFRTAKRKKLCQSNPFDEVSAPAVTDKRRRRFVERSAIDEVLEECSPEWRLIVVLARYAGLRCPSEVLSLKFEDINFRTGRMVITSPKTEHHEGKEFRVCPIFPEVRPELERAFENAPEGAVYVLEAYRARSFKRASWKSTNLRTQLLRILKRAGVDPWPKLFQGMRASCETELLQRFPEHVVAAWLGHSVRVQQEHYAMVRDEDFAAASEATQNPTQSGAVSGLPALSGGQATHEPSLRILGKHAELQRFSRRKVGVTGFEPVTSSV
ncbi:tyrosine-type recombinase/integrase [Caulifigura coniformis]|uniref:tyrosine-type recombinase/integrase n=1 Tax=Caulifigura coniformis TaxID=2527983 RepID=UPI0036F28BF5